DGSGSGKPPIAKFFPGGVVQCNVLAGGNASLYPTPNAFPTVADWNAGFVDLSGGEYRVARGSVLEKSGCHGPVRGGVWRQSPGRWGAVRSSTRCRRTPVICYPSPMLASVGSRSTTAWPPI